MAKEDETQKFEEPKQKKHEEIYGEIQEKLTFNKAIKAEVHRTNKLFKEAKYDLRKDALNKGKDGYQESNEGLDRFMIYFAETAVKKDFFTTYKTYKELKKSNKTEELESKEYAEFFNLEKNYNALKQDLKNTRVLGVGKTAIEKTKTLARNCLVSCARVVGVALSPIAGLAIGIGGTADPDILFQYSVQSKLGKIREALSDNVYNIYTKQNKTPPVTKEYTKHSGVIR